SQPSSLICSPNPFSAATACSSPSYAPFKSACASCPLPRILSLSSTACAAKRLYSVLRSRISASSWVRRGNSSSASSRVNCVGGIPHYCSADVAVCQTTALRAARLSLPGCERSRCSPTSPAHRVLAAELLAECPAYGSGHVG